MNKQPFYHRVTVLFTATEELTEADVLKKVRKGLSGRQVIASSVEIEEFDEPMPGDPADLMS